ncbi:MAG: M16 family metallopeptidase [Myxococcales bacterium]
MKRCGLLLSLLCACATTKGAQKDKEEENKPVPTPASEQDLNVAPPGTPDSPFRAHKPAPLAGGAPFRAPVPVERRLSNGARLLVVENHALPLVSVEVAIETGVDGEPLAQRGLARFVAVMLSEGTRRRSALELAIAREDLAAEIGGESGLDAIYVDLSALAELLPQSLDLLAEVIREPAFRKADVERVRGILLTRIKAKKGEPAALAEDELSRLLYGDRHPWGLPAGGTPRTLAAITAKDLARFHRSWFVPNNAVIAVSGDVTADRAQALLEKAFAGWKPRPLGQRAPETFPAEGARSIALADVPGASQSQLRVGWRTVPAADPDAVPLLVANNVLGGLFTSRLNLNLREDKAYSYGVFSHVRFTGDTGRIVAQGGVVAAHTADAVREIEGELARFETGGVSAEELARAKTALVRGLPARYETNGAVVRNLIQDVLDGLPPDYDAKLPALVAAVGPADVARVAAKRVTPDRWPVVVVGPRSSSEAQLAKLGLGPVTLVQPE